MTKDEKKELMKLACKVRMGVVEGTHAAKSGHPGGSLSAADVYTYLYFKEMKDIRRDECWQIRSQTDILNAKIKECQQDTDCLLSIP